MSRRPPCLSLVSSNLLVNAYPDGRLTCKMGSSKAFTRLSGKATALLALVGPNGEAWRILVGDHKGGLTLLSLPNLVEVHHWRPHEDEITCLNAERRSNGLVLLSGDMVGKVMAHGDQIPGHSLELFSVDGRVGALRSLDERLHVHVGWKRHILHWDGNDAKLIEAKTAFPQSKLALNPA